MWPGADGRIGAPGRAAPAPHAPDGADAAQWPGASPPVDCLPSAAGLIRRIRAYDPTADAATVERAFEMALEAHAEQKRDNGEPYITHPLAVAGILAGFRWTSPASSPGCCTIRSRTPA